MAVDTATIFLFLGGLLLVMGLLGPMMMRLPLTPALVYLVVGIIVGPTVLGIFHFNPLKESRFLEVATELAVLLSLFTAGLKMPVPIRLRYWRAPILLASLSMALTVALVAAFGYWALGLPLGVAVLLGAVVAPTDPVLATEVQVRHAGDTDELRFSLTSEAGMNDGSAFPFVMLGLGLLGLHELGQWGWRWVAVDVIWSTAIGVGIGIAGGAILGRLVCRMHARGLAKHLLDVFLGLGLIGLVYGLSLLLEGWGFLSVFFAAVALRQTEAKLLGRDPEPPQHLYTENHQGHELSAITDTEASTTDASLAFKEQLERLSEVVLILLIGGTLFEDSWSWRAVGLAFFLFLVARPLAVWLGLAVSGARRRVRNMVAWFGVRGIGSLYYLMYAIQHGLAEEHAILLIHFVLVVVTLSIVVHGISVKPLMDRFWPRQ